MASKLTNGVSETSLPLEQLSKKISENASIVSQYLGENYLPQPSLDSDGPSTVIPSSSPQSVQQARQTLIAASLETLQLAIGPSEFLPNLATGVRHAHSPLHILDKTYSWCKVSIYLLPLLALPIQNLPPRSTQRDYQLCGPRRRGPRPRAASQKHHTHGHDQHPFP